MLAVVDTIMHAVDYSIIGLQHIPKIINNQHHACILEAIYYLNVFNVHFKFFVAAK